MIQFLIVSGIFPWFLNLFIGFLVFFKNPRRQLNRIFCLFSCTVAFWSVGSFLVQVVRDGSLSLFIARSCYSFALILPSLFLYFVLTLIGREENRIIGALLGLVPLVFLPFLWGTPLFISGLRQLENYDFWVVNPGPVYYLFFFFFCFAISAALIVLYASLRKEKGAEKIRRQYVFAAYLIAALAGLEYFLTVFGIFRTPPFDDYVLIMPFVLISYAIVKHRLMDIEVVIKKTLVFAGLAAFALAIFAFTTFAVQEVLRSYVGGGRGLSLVLSVFVIVLGYEPLRNLLVNLTDRYLFQRKINYRMLLKEASEYLAHLDSLKRQARRIIAFLLVKARISNASIYAFQSYAPGSVLLQASRPCLKVDGHKTIAFSHPLARYMKTHRGPIDLAQIQNVRKQAEDASLAQDLDAIISLLTDHRAEAAIPCFGSDAAERARRTELHLRGVLFVGHQKSDEVYNEEDLDVFFSLGQQSSIAFENARLFDEAVTRSHELGATNRDLKIAQTNLLGALHDAEKSRQAAERSREEAVEAKKKTEEMELELVMREKLLFVEQLVQGLAHEIFSPIQPMLFALDSVEAAYVNLFLRFKDSADKNDIATQREYYTGFKAIKEGIESLGRGIKHIQSVVDTLAQLQRKDVQAIQPFDLGTFCQVAHPLMAMETHSETFTEIPVKYDVPRYLPLVLGNPTQLTQVFINLFRNANHAMNNRAKKEIMVTAQVDPSNSDYVELRFSDNGPGIPSEVLPRIFDFQYTTKGSKGQGIGLSQCKLIIEKVFKGTIRCESRVGEGATFIIQLLIHKGGERHADENTYRG